MIYSGVIVTEHPAAEVLALCMVQFVITIVRTCRSYGDAVFHSVHGSFYTGLVKGLTFCASRGGGGRGTYSPPILLGGSQNC